MKAKDLDKMGTFDAVCGAGIVRVVSKLWGVRVGAVFMEVDKHRSVAETGLMYYRLVASMVVYYPHTQF